MLQNQLLRLLLLCFSFALLSTPKSLHAQSTWKLSPKQSTCTWQGSAAVGLYTVTGTLVPKSGSLTLTEEQITAGNVVMDMKSLATDSKQMAKHLRDDDFFDVKQYPEADFQLQEPLHLSTEPGKAAGTITIKGQSEAIEVPVRLSKSESNWVLEGQLILDRTRFGITYNSPSLMESLEEQAISDEIGFAFKLVFED